MIAFGLWATNSVRYRPMPFSNPGNRRLLKNEAGSYYYFRSLPEKSMSLDVKSIPKIQLRAFGLEPLKKPQVITLINKKRTSYDLVLAERLNGYYIYNPVEIDIPQGTDVIEILCYDRSVYFRSFFPIQPKPKTPPKPKPETIPNLKVLEHSGIVMLNHNSSSSEYHSFKKERSLKFELNNQRNAAVYIRARLTDRSLPVFAIYKDGELIAKHEFTLKRTTKYKAPGITHLSTGMKIELPKNSGKSVYEFISESGHLFIARPIVLKK